MNKLFLDAEWNPIETSPRDGTPILACIKSVTGKSLIEVNWWKDRWCSFDFNRYFLESQIWGWTKPPQLPLKKIELEEKSE